MGDTKRDRLKTARLVEQARLGDDQAFSELYHLYFKGVYYVALKLLADPDLARDVTCETFEVAYRKLQDLEKPVTFQKWLSTISRNRALDVLRRDKRSVEQFEQEGLDEYSNRVVEPSRDANPELSLKDQEDQRVVLGLIEELPLAQRESVLLHYYEGLSAAEIAEVTGAQKKAIYKRLTTARENLAAKIKAQNLSEDLAGRALRGGIIASALDTDANTAVTKVVEFSVKKTLEKGLGISLPATSHVATPFVAGAIGSKTISLIAAGAVLLAGAGAALYAEQNMTHKDTAAITVGPAPPIRVDVSTPNETPAPAKTAEETTPSSSPQSSQKTIPEKVPVVPVPDEVQPQKPQLKPPVISLATDALTYPAGTVVPLSQILEEVDAFAVSSTGEVLAIATSGYAEAMFSTPATYVLQLSTKDRVGNTSHAALTIYVQ